MFSNRLYFLSEFLLIYKQERFQVAAEDIKEKLDAVCRLYDECMAFNDKRVSPTGTTEHFILINHYPMYGSKIIGYRVFFTSKDYCELFEIFVSKGHRKQGIGAGLIRESIDWVMSQGISKFGLKLVESEGLENPLIHFYNKLEKELENRCSFDFK